MSSFTIDAFSRACTDAMARADDPQAAARSLLERTLADTPTADLVATLDAAVPAGADIGELVFHVSPALTMLYGRIPPRFRSGIHDHTMWACIAQLVGEEKNVLYARDGAGLRVVDEFTLRPGDIGLLSSDTIHHIENPGTAAASALHLYGGDFGAAQSARSLWTSVGHQERAFSFPELLRESVVAMKRDSNEEGLAALVAAMPAARAIVEG